MKSIKGFTLVELMVVVAIVAGLAGMVIPKFLNYNRSQELESSASDLQSAVRKTQNNAGSGVVCSANKSSGTWYLKFISDNSYKIETACANSNVEAGTPTPTPPQSLSYQFKEGIKVESIDIITGSSTCTTEGRDASGFGIEFTTITGAGKLLSGDVSCPVNESLTSRMTVKLTSGEESKLVVIEKGGSVYVQGN